MKLFGIEHTDEKCPRCMDMVLGSPKEMAMGSMDERGVMPVPVGARAPISVTTRKPICYDCAAAESITRFQPSLNFYMARIAVLADRSESLRLPRVPLGLMRRFPFVKPSEPGDLDRLYDWQQARVPSLEEVKMVMQDKEMETKS